MRMAAVRDCASVIGMPSTDVTTSPFCSPARAAGVPLAGLSATCAPIVKRRRAGPGGRGHRDAQETVGGRTGGNDLVGNALCVARRHGESDADAAAVLTAGRGRRRSDSHVHANDVAVRVDERTAGVAVVDRCVGLDHVQVDRVRSRSSGSGRIRPAERSGTRNRHPPEPSRRRIQVLPRTAR